MKHTVVGQENVSNESAWIVEARNKYGVRRKLWIGSQSQILLKLAETVFMGSGIFKSEDPAPRAKAIVDAVAYYDNPEMLARISSGLGQPMSGLDVRTMPEGERMASRGW